MRVVKMKDTVCIRRRDVWLCRISQIVEPDVYAFQGDRGVELNSPVQVGFLGKKRKYKSGAQNKKEYFFHMNQSGKKSLAISVGIKIYQVAEYVTYGYRCCTHLKYCPAFDVVFFKRRLLNKRKKYALVVTNVSRTKNTNIDPFTSYTL